MRSNAYKRDKYTAEFYKFVVTDEGSDAVIDYYFVKNVSITVVVDDNNRINIRSNEALPIGSLLRNIKDANGDLILDDMVWRVETLVPVQGPFNSIESYRSRLLKYTGLLDV